MAFTVNGTTFTPQTTQQHSTDILNYVNGLLNENSMPNLTPTMDNALWWTMLGTANIQQIYDMALLQASNSFNPSACDDNQILNLLTLAGTELISASPTTVMVRATSNNSYCIIPSGLLYSVNNVAYQITSGFTIPASGYHDFQGVCLSNGPNVITVGSVTPNSITSPKPANLSGFTNIVSAIPGRTQETPSQARKRILNQSQKTVPWDQCQIALNNLPGVTTSAVFFNPSPSVPLVLAGGVSVPARNAYIVLAGNNPDIAKTYWSYMFSPTSGNNSQFYTSNSGQALGVYWDSPSSQVIYVKVSIDANKPIMDGYKAEISNLLMLLNGFLLPGVSISSEIIISQIANATQSTVVGALVSLDGITYSAKVTPNANSAPFFASDDSVMTFVSI